MDKEQYSVAEFRANIRIALDRADDGNDVFIKRHGRRYFVCSEEFYNELKKPDVEFAVQEFRAESPKRSGIIKTPEEAVEKIKKIFPKAESQHFCKEGHAIPEGRSKCMGKGCKYS